MAKFCPECGKPVAETSKFCSSCGASLSSFRSTGQGGPAGVHKKKSPSLALLCSFFIPGLGQVYDGNTIRGIAVFIGTIGGSYIFYSVPGLIVWTYGLYDARSTAKRMNNGEIPFQSTKMAHMIVFLILAALVMAVIIYMALMDALAMFNSISMMQNYPTLPFQ